MKIFISHKQEDESIAYQLADELSNLNVEYYLDLVDSEIVGSGKQLTDHIKENLNDCTDIIVIMSYRVANSQWVPFEVGMAAQINMPTATFLQESVELPEFLEFWPRLKHIQDIRKYVYAGNQVDREYERYDILNESATFVKNKTERFYELLKARL